MIETLFQDLRYGLRMLVKSPGFTAVAVATLALGIGANTALFSVINGVLLSPLTFPRPDQLVTLHENKPNFEGGSVSYPNFRDWQRDNHTFSSLALARTSAFSLTGIGDAEQVSGEFVSSDFFSVLGVKPVIGRTFAEDEERVGAGAVALISAGLWRRKFSSVPDILGKNITLDARDYTIVGVIPADFHLVIPGFQDSQVYAPIGQWSNPLLLKRGAGLGFHGIGRLKPGVTIEQARADMEGVTRSLAEAFPDADKGITAKLTPLKEQIIGHVRPQLLVLLAAVGFVLLIACVNVANLLLARATSRTREFAVRAALGASQGRVIRQLLTESVLIALAGGGLGLLLAGWGTRAALGVLPAALPRAEQVGLDTHVLIFTLGISLVAGVLFGLTPALKTSQSDLHETLKQGGRGVSGTRHRMQSVFVVAEMALAVVLLIGAGLTIRSLATLWSVDPGFNPHNVLTFGLSLPPAMMRAKPDAIRAAFREFDDKLASVPGIQAVSQTWGAVPFSGDDEQLFWLEGQPKPANENDMNWGIDYIVEPGYLKAMGIPLLRGRFFTAQDNEHSPLVVVVDEVFAQKYFSNKNPIGKRINLAMSNQLAEIVGVVGHVKQWGLATDDQQSLRSDLYIPCMQMSDDFIAMAPSASSVVVRSEGNSPRLLDSIRHTNAQMSKEQAIFGTQTMDSLISDSMASRRFSMILLVAFAMLALLLASVGIYGVISYVVGQRTNEIGIRMALGAHQRDILFLILGGGGKLAGLGVAIGLAAAWGLTRFMASLLYGVGATDTPTFAGVSVLLTMVALAACYIPARRAAKVDPMVALRYE
ncbi:MAG TPA: ABC transporter permease [Terriglobales bacterium]|jgi:predicted permease|nr:ABC transporter permease [Terriglobales bacterium]